MQIVPQYIDVEDKIAGPLTWKHIGWLFAGSGILIVAFLALDVITFIIVGLPIFLLTLALAFYRPQGVSLVEFVGYGFSYMFRPKKYLWSRDADLQQQNKKIVTNTSAAPEKEKLSIDDISAIAQTLDSDGAQRNERVQELIKQNKKSK